MVLLGMCTRYLCSSTVTEHSAGQAWGLGGGRAPPGQQVGTLRRKDGEQF